METNPRFEIEINSNDILYGGNLRGINLLVNVNSIINPTRNNIARILRNLGECGSQYAKNENLVPENPTMQDAIKIIYHASNTRRKNPAMIGYFNGIYYKNAKKMLQAAQSYLAQEYDGTYTINAYFLGVNHREFNIFETPYGRFSRSHWSVTQETNEEYGYVRRNNDGIHLGDSVIYKDKSAVVINASHEHGAFGEGTKIIQIRYSDGSIENVVPWLIKKIQ